MASARDALHASQAGTLVGSSGPGIGSTGAAGSVSGVSGDSSPGSSGTGSSGSMGGKLSGSGPGCTMVEVYPESFLANSLRYGMLAA